MQTSRNPPAQWLWRPEDEILGSKLLVRVGGSFTWPPLHLHPATIDRLVLIAGGVGIKWVLIASCLESILTADSPLISIFSHLIRSSSRPKEIHFVYTTKADESLDRQRILFLPRLMDLVAAEADVNVTLSLFLTGLDDTGLIEHGKFPNRTFARRLRKEDLSLALDGYSEQGGDTENHRAGTVCYVCGPPQMTDDFVAFLSRQPGMTEQRVLCEKWW